MGKSKQRYLSSTIVKSLLFGYSAVVVLLIAMNSFIVLNCQQRYLQTQRELVQKEAQRMSASLKALRDCVYKNWYGNENFARLGQYSKDDNLIEYRYDLMEELELSMSITSGISGFYVFYTGRETCAYVTDAERITPEENLRLQELLCAYHKANSPAARKFFFLFPDENSHYAIIGYSKGNATIYGIYRFDRSLSILETALPSGSELAIKEMPDSCLVDEDNAAADIAEQIEGLDVCVLANIPMGFKDFFNIQLFFGLTLLAGSIMILIWLMYFMRLELITPLKGLKRTMEEIRCGKEYRLETRLYSLKELDEINRTFGYMLQALEDQKVATYENVLEKQKARIQYLQLQLKPHFYLNGLKTVSALAYNADTNKLQQYLQKLSAHMRYLLSLEKETIELEEELKFTENYVDLQRQMTGRKIDYSVCCGETDCKVMVPVLCIQTFVENSIKYAKLGDTTARLKISVEVIRLEADEDAYLDISVADNGPGYPGHVLQQLKEGAVREGENVGINNIRQRCDILYRGKASFLFENRDGAKSEMLFPTEFTERSAES